MGFCYLFATLLISFRCCCSPVLLILCITLYSVDFGSVTRVLYPFRQMLALGTEGAVV